MSYALESGSTNANGQGVVVIGDGANLDAFSRLRTSDPWTLFSTSSEYGRQTSLWYTITSGASSTTNHLNNKSAVELVCGTEADAYCIRQTKQFFHYQPGKSQMVVATFTMGAAVAGVRRRVGYFETENGIFLEQNGTTDVAIVRRSKATGSIVDTRVVQADWNLDKLNGAGGTANPSGYTLNLAKAQILFIDLQWLGMGRVRVGFDIDGKVVYVHEFRNANNLTTVYMTTGTLPIRYEIANTSLQGSTNTLEQVCSMVSSEGGVQQEDAYHFSAAANTARTVSTRRAIISIRPAATFGPSNRINRTTIVVHDIDLLIGSNDVYWEIVYNPTFTTSGGALTWTGLTESAAEYCVHGDANAGAFTGGTVIESGYLPATAAGASARSSLSATIAGRNPLTLDIAGANPIAFSLVATSLSSNATVRGVLNWEEVR